MERNWISCTIDNLLTFYIVQHEIIPLIHKALFESKMLPNVFRSPSCMAISRSYPRNLVKFCEEKKHFTSYFFCVFYKDASFLAHLVIIIWCFPIWLSSFIKLSHGDLQCKFIQTFFQQFSNLNLVVYKNPESRYILFIIGTRWDRVEFTIIFLTASFRNIIWDKMRWGE